MAFILTRLQVGDYDVWKPMFDTDGPGARRAATRHRVFRNVDDPNEVFIQIEYPSLDDANAARDLLVASGVLDRFEDKHGPTVCEVADDVTH
jgi:hypothetical protein